MTFKQDGEKLTGHYSGQLGEADLTGTVKGQDIEFKFAAEIQDRRSTPSIPEPWTARIR